MKNCYSIFLFFFLLAGTNLMAFHSTLSGFVIDEETGEALPGALVQLVEPQRFTTTNDLGYFVFDGLDEGTYDLKITYIGFAEKVMKGVVLKEDSEAIRIYMAPRQIELPLVEIQPLPDGNKEIISQLDLKTRPIQNGQEILRLVPGLFIAQHAGGGKAEQIFLRGFDIDHGTDVRLTVDGTPVNMVSHAHGQGYADLHFLIPELVGEVSYTKGTYDAAIGNFATAGSVEFETVDRLKENFVKLEAGQFDSYRLLAGTALTPSNDTKQHAYIAAGYQFSDGYFESSQNFYRFNVLGKYSRKLSDDQTLKVTLSSFASEWDASGQIPQRAIDDGTITRFGAIDDTEGGQTSRTDLSVEHLKVLPNNSLIKNQFFITHYEFELYSNFTFFDRDPINGDQIRQKENRNVLGWNTSLQQDHFLGELSGNYEVGLQVRFDAVNDNELSYTLNRVTTLEEVALGNVREMNIGLYAKENLQLSSDLFLTAGLRYDYFRFQYRDKTETTYNQQYQSRGLLLPKLSLFYNLGCNVQLRAQSGIGYHSNDTRVVVAQEGESVLPKAYGAETGALFKIGRSLIAEAGVWFLDLEQEFVYVGDEGIVEPSGKTRRLGTDVSIRYQPVKWLQLDVDLNYAHARSREAEEGADRIPLAPIWTSTGGIQVINLNGFGGSLRYRYLGDRPANEDNTLTADGYFLLDALAYYRLPKVEFGVQAQNLLNREWKEAQFETTSRLFDEPDSISEIHFTPGSPFFLRGYVTFYF